MSTTMQRVATISLGLVVTGSLTACSGLSPATPVVSSTTPVGVPSPTSLQTSTPVPGVTTSSSAAPAAVVTPTLTVWNTDRSTSKELRCVPVPTGPAGRYRLKITDALRACATATTTVP